jgi:hypothetical protein
MLFIVWLLAILAFLSSLKFTFMGDEELENKLINLITHPGWSFSMFAFIPMFLGQFARGEASPIPWIEFMNELSTHGFLNGLLAIILVTAVDLWLFWIPGHLYIKSNPEIDKRFKYAIRFLNIATGLLLVTENNPIYRILEIS